MISAEARKIFFQGQSFGRFIATIRAKTTNADDSTIARVFAYPDASYGSASEVVGTAVVSVTVCMVVFAPNTVTFAPSSKALSEKTDSEKNTIAKAMQSNAIKVFLDISHSLKIKIMPTLVYTK